jgi:hypothetical protein
MIAHNKTLHQTSFIITILLAAIALMAVIPVSYTTLMTNKGCPYLWLIPACYIVTIGYTLILISLFTRKNNLFLMGWSPVFLLALAGTITELSGVDVCPKASSGTPMCYFSLAFSVVIALFYVLWKKSKVSA